MRSTIDVSIDAILDVVPMLSMMGVNITGSEHAADGIVRFVIEGQLVPAEPLVRGVVTKTVGEKIGQVSLAFEPVPDGP
jgi:hypothetical protein